MDLKMAIVAVAYYRRAHILSKRPVPPSADRLADHLQQTLLSANGQEMPAAQTHWLSTRQAARLLGCSDRTARRIAARVGRRIGRDWLIPADAIREEDE
ncbi:MAG: helix-turn-helix domain-containing protein [Mycobacterium sp.]